jgi:hypothetical protein
MYNLTLEYMVQIVKKKKKKNKTKKTKKKLPPKLNVKNFRNYVHLRKMHKFRTTPTQAKTRCDNSKTTFNMII